ncbi:uncharacterized protein FIBRA_00244 [Fibroporia radiculosa]|uniref:Cytochrome c oxidase assembly factor 3 n=1 Tax=Fibroporia radiculosa TaxID=599839 RepID=J7RV84_9APHY|nr:uncharacterized protein FIBRA_00244 [Fibroporia radiculosa]CCL98250.1 predicted protein [Fibroporia radiculosa]
MADPYISRKEANTSYRPYNNLMSPGLQRAREPFRIRNAVTGTLLLSFAVGVWAYSISAVKQDVFDDVDEEARSLARAREQSLVQQDAERERKLAEEVAMSSNAAAPAAIVMERATPSASAPGGRGVLPALLEQWFPRLLDPSTKTLVWGAPSVDNIGTLRDGSRR